MIRYGTYSLPVLSFSVLLTVLTACSKREDLQRISTYSFINTLKKEVNIDFYSSKDDYNNAGNAIKSLKLPQGEMMSVELEALDTFWIDWYSADFSLNNWGIEYGSNTYFYGAYPPPELRVAAQDDKISISSKSTDISRSVLLNGSGLSSSWRADISGIEALDGTHNFTFRRDFKGVYSYTSTAGDTIIAPISYSLFQLRPLYFRMNIWDDQEGQLAEIYFNSDPNSYPNFGRDTLMVNFRRVSYYDYYPAKRQ